VRPVAVDPEIRLPVPARLPEDYVAEVSQRLVLYKRLAGALDDAELERIRDEILDRYGPLPEEARNLLGVIRVKIRARSLGIQVVEAAKGSLVLTASTASRVDAGLLLRLLSDPRSGIRVLPDQKIATPLPSREPAAVFETAERLLERLAAA
jgi:transcription-repair coupling factor (superfamily II helicase)